MLFGENVITTTEFPKTAAREVIAHVPNTAEVMRSSGSDERRISQKHRVRVESTDS